MGGVSRLGLITVNAALFSEQSHIFTEAQEGFLRGRNTERQVQNLLHAIEDAATTGQDLLLLYIDFTSAFNTIDHDKLLIVMRDLGYPTDFIEVVRDLYGKAATRVRTEHGATQHIPIQRGTVQGDVLSPLLFIIFMEPLLRWLHVGGRGYRFGCLTKQENDKHNLSSGAFADDLVTITSHISDMRIQAEKIEKYAAWGAVLVSSIYTVEICPKSAEGGEKFLGLGATHLRSVDGFGRFWRKNGGSVDVLGGLGA